MRTWQLGRCLVCVFFRGPKLRRTLLRNHCANSPPISAPEKAFGSTATALGVGWTVNTHQGAQACGTLMHIPNCRHVREGLRRHGRNLGVEGQQLISPPLHPFNQHATTHPHRRHLWEVLRQPGHHPCVERQELIHTHHRTQPATTHAHLPARPGRPVPAPPPPVRRTAAAAGRRGARPPTRG